MTPFVLAAVVALRTAAAPPATLNIVHHKLKRHEAPAYQTLEASIVSAYERAKVPLYWTTFQSVKDPRDVLYLHMYDTPADMTRATESYKTLAPAHPDLAKLSAKLSSLLDAQASMLVTRRDEIAYNRADVDFTTMRALMLATFRVKAGHEGQFIDAIRRAGGGGAPWVVYESTADPTFVLVWPLRSRSEAKGAAIPRALRELRRAYTRADAAVYTLAPAMSRPKPKGH